MESKPAGSKKKPSKDKESYKKVKMLGEGSQGKVYLVTCGSDGSSAAIKQIQMGEMEEEEKIDVLNEIKLLDNMHHPNITALKEAYDTKGGRKNIVMEVADGDDLEEEVKNKKMISKLQAKPLEYFKENTILDWFTQILIALKYVHEKRILHRDLKPQNIFKTKTGIIKLGDFGVAKVLNNTMGKASTEIGTPLYLSPEIVRSESYNTSTDIWSLGVTIYELCALQRPFDTTKGILDLNEKILKGAYEPMPDTYSKELQRIVASMLSVDPKKRPSVKQILKDPLIVGRLRCVLVSPEFKDQFAKLIMLSDNCYHAYENKVVDKDDENSQKRKDYDGQLSGLQQGDWKPKTGQDPSDFFEMYQHFIDRINPYRSAQK